MSLAAQTAWLRRQTLAATCLMLLALWHSSPAHPGMPGWLAGQCLFRRLTGIQCPGCGLLHATGMALTGHVDLSFAVHPFGPIAALGLVLAIAYGLATEVLPGSRLAMWAAEVRAVSRLDLLFTLLLVGFWLMSVANEAIRGER